VKIQSQNGLGTFDHGAFYTGNNGSGNFFTLSSPVPSPAILDVFFCGMVATMGITGAAGVQTCTNDYPHHLRSWRRPRNVRFGLTG